MKRFVLLISCLLTVVTFAQEKRLALIIGNSHYVKGTPLSNPLNDARAMDDALQQLGFTTMRFENLTLNQMKRAIDQFGKQLHHYDVGLFYYAGHGIQYKGHNYLIPVEADLFTAELIELDCVPVDRVLAYMEHSGTAVNLLVLDACRNNPFERSWHRSISGNGLAFMNAPSGSLIAYATAPGSVASDGTGENGLYTGMLLKHIGTPNLTVEQVFKRVRTDIETVTKKQQIPWESTSLKGDFYFNPDSAHLAAMEASIREKQAALRTMQTVKRHSIRLQAEIPVQWGVGYGFNFTKHVSVELQAGRISQPNSFLMTNMMGSLGSSELNLMIKNSYTSGYVYEGGLNIHFGNNYMGVFTQGIRMRGAAATSEVEQNFDTDLNSMPVKTGRTEVKPSQVNISSDLTQAGILYGRILPLTNPAWQLRLEFALSKNIGSFTRLESADRDLSSMQQEVNAQMDSWFNKYGYVPSLTLAIAHTFGSVIR